MPADLHLAEMDCPNPECRKQLLLANIPIPAKRAEAVRETEEKSGRTVVTPGAFDYAFTCPACEARIAAVASGPAIIDGLAELDG